MEHLPPAPSLSGCWCKGLHPPFLLLRGSLAVWVRLHAPTPFSPEAPLPRYSTLPGRRALKNSLVSQKDDVHVCILCLRAIMNYQVRQ